MKKIYQVILLGFLFGPMIGWGQQVIGTFPAMNGGFEGASVDNTTFASAQAGKWVKNNNTQTIALDNSVARSGGSSISVNNGTTGRRVWSPLIIASSTTSSVTIQYWRRITNATNTQESMSAIGDGTTADVQSGTYSAPAAINTWEKVTYTRSSWTYTNIAGAFLTRAIGTGGLMNFDDLAMYNGAVDITAPNSPASITVNNPTTSSLDVSWPAAVGGVDGGGYVVVRYATNPNANNDPNQNGIYAVGNTTINGTGGLTGAIRYIGTGTSFTDNVGLLAGTPYWYKVYTVDKAFNYSAETQGTGTTAVPPPTVTTVAASSITVSGAILNGTVNGNGNASTASFEYGLTTGYGTSISATTPASGAISGSTTTSTALSITSLAVNTQYNFRAVASGGAGGTVNGLNATFYTLANIPNAPTAGNATGNSLDVTIGTGDGNPAITAYAIQETGGQYVQSDGSLGATAVFQTAAAWATKTVTGLLPATTYSFQVKARNGDLTATSSVATATATTLNIYLSPASQSYSSLCNGANNNIALTYISGGTVTAPYIELSDASGSFVANTVSLPSTVLLGSPNTITGIIPAGQTISSLYRIRIVSSDAIPIISLNNGNNISIITSAIQSVTIGITAGSNPNCAGTSVTFTATPTNGGLSPTYQWKKNGADISLATGGTYTSSSLAMNDAISCVMTSSISCTTTPTATSNSITITINPLPANPTNPVVAGTNPSCGATSLNTMAADPNTNFYWQGTVLNGQSSTNETTSPFTVNTTGTYYVTALGTNGCWSAGSGSILVTVNTAPSISVQPPATKSISSNGSTSFSITAGNAAGFQWQVDQGTGFTNIVDGGVYSGATTNTLSLTSVPLSYTGYVYQCIVKATTCADLLSASVTLTVNDVPWEDFETGTKTTYTIGNVTCKAGSWSFNNALIGTSTSDFIVGTQSARITSTGDITMNFDVTTGLGIVTVGHGMYGTDVNGSWRLEASTNGGSTWTAFVSPTYTSTASAFAYQNITVNIAGTVRFRIVKLSSSSLTNRLNIDNIYITTYTACTAPATEATFTSFTNVLTTSATINFGSGTGGAGRIVVVKQGSAIAGFPTLGVTYSPASSDFSTVLPTIATNEKVVYSGTGNTVTVTGLIANTDYYVKIFEYAGSKCYLNSSTGNTGTTTTACNTPATLATNAIVSLVTSSTASIGFTIGNGTNRLVVVNAGSAVTGTPVNGASYSANSSYSAAPAFTPGTGKTVYNSTSNTVALTNLTSNTVYYVAVFEFNSPSNCYVSTGATTSFTTSSLLSDIISAAGESSCISSIVNGNIASVADGTQVWQFTIRDGGASMPDADGVPTIINSIAISQGVSNTVSDWTNIQSAALFNGNILVATGVITSTKITFTGAPLISVADDNTTTLSLRITLKNPVSISTSIDGKVFRFSITEANITIAASGSSGKNTSALVATTDVTKDVVCVVATKLVFSTQPSNTGQNQSMSPSVAVTAYDANNNIDLDFTQSVSISSTALAGLTGSPVSSNAIAGVASFAGIKHTSIGTYQMTASSINYSDVVSNNYSISVITTFSQGDFAILALNNNNSTSVDEIAFVAFKDIAPGTSFYMTDNGYERAYAGKWGTSEGIVQFTRTGSTIPAGTILNTKGINSAISIYSCGVIDANWTISTGATVLPGTSALFDMNDGDQVWFMQGGAGSWTSAGGGGSAQDGVFSGGNVLYGWSGIAWKTNIGTSPTTWTTKGSRIFPSMKCFSTELNLVTDPGKTKYTGPTTVTTRLGWISRINNILNWTTYPDNATYNSTGPDYLGGCITYSVATGTEVDGKWTGGRNTDWFDCNNWDTRVVPSATTNVNISSTATNVCVVDNVTNTATAILFGNVADCNNLSLDGKSLSTGNATDVINVNGNFTLSNSATLNMTGGGTFNLQSGDWSNTASTFTSGSGTVSFNSANSQTIEAENYNNLTSSSSGARVLASSGTIGVKSLFTPGINTYTIANSTVDFNGVSAAQTIPAFIFYNVGFKNGGTKSLGGNISVQKTLTVGASTNFALLSNNVTLKSISSLTANVTTIPSTATIDQTGSGRFIIERYIDGLRSWRLLAAPISSLQTMRSAWMEGATVASLPSFAGTDPVAGYGTHITGPLPGTNGFDASPLNNYSVKYHNGTTWVGTGIQPDTSTLNYNNGWMIFVRGNRSYSILNTTSGTAPVTTTLRTTGQINIGDKTFAISPTPSGFTVVGNPYPSAINFSSISKIGPGDVFYIWDPKITSGTTSSTVGGFITMTRSTGTTYTSNITPQSSMIDLLNGRIESGLAFLVNSLNITSLTIKETDKSNLSATFFRPQTPAILSNTLRATLYVKNNDNSLAVFDGALHLFDDTYHNELTGEDALKPGNFAESFGITKKDKLLSIEKRNLPIETDTIFYNLSKMRLRNYLIEFTADNLAQHNLAGYIEDVYLKNKTALNMIGSTKVEFKVTTDTASYAANRFRIVFKKAINYNTINAYLHNSDVAVDWQVAGEKNIHHYEIERSADGINFSAVRNTASNGNNASVNNYSGLDEKPAPGIYYYRIKGISNNGAIGYSETVKVVMMNVKGGLYVYPNPVTNGTIRLQMNSMYAGVYHLRLLNSAGQSIVTKTVNHAGGTASVNISYPAQLTGHYQLEVMGVTKKKTVLKVVIQ